MLDHLEAAWNSADGPAFGALYALDASFVNIRGEHIQGSAAIGAGHEGIFTTIYAGSTNRMELVSAEQLADGVELSAHRQPETAIGLGVPGVRLRGRVSDALEQRRGRGGGGRDGTMPHRPRQRTQHGHRQGDDAPPVRCAHSSNYVRRRVDVHPEREPTGWRSVGAIAVAPMLGR